jgi:anti-sigma regulatory factor (Ser/Thr protein kinase)
MNAEASYTIANRRADVAAFADVFEGFCVRHRVATVVLRAFQVAFDELLTNIVDYAHADDADHPIEVALRLDGERLVAEVVDSGAPFDPLQDSATPDIELEIDDRPVGGLGIHLVRTLMDEVSYRRDGERNRLLLAKRLTPPA